MSTEIKYRVSQVVVAITVPIMCYMFSHMIPAGLNGDTATVKKWFAGSMIMVALGCAAYISMTYYRSRLSTSETSAQAMDVLSAAAADAARQKQLNRQKHQPEAPVGQPPKRLV